MSVSQEPTERAGGWGITTGVGITALWVAAARAAETARPGRLCADPYADAMVAAADAPVALPTRLSGPREQGWDAELATVWESMVVYMSVRTRFFDDFLIEAVCDGPGQVVILAAGLDTRAHRLDWPAGTQVFELDQPRVLAFKDQVLGSENARPRCGRHPVGIDLREDWPTALKQAGFDPERPTAWLAEGLLPYLPEAAERDLFARIAALSAPGSRVGLNDSHDLAARLSDPRWARLFECLGVDPTTLWYAEPSRPDPGTWFRDHGWRASTSTLGEVAARYDRRLPSEMADLFARRSRYCTAARLTTNETGADR
jgi:methyltransferase (TIGR00027 family)